MERWEREGQDHCSAVVLRGQMSMLKPGEWGHCKIRIQNKASQELGLEVAKAQLRKWGSELRVRVASQDRRNKQCRDVKCENDVREGKCKNDFQLMNNSAKRQVWLEERNVMER